MTLDQELIYAAVMHDNFPNKTFYRDGSRAYVVEGESREELFIGTAVCEAYFCDLNADGYPEICATVGEDRSNIIICDYKNGVIYSRTMRYDENPAYELYLSNDRLYLLENYEGKRNLLSLKDSIVAFFETTKLKAK